MTLETGWRDLRQAIRNLGRNPGFTLVAAMALALGIGADTAVFTIVKGALNWNLGLDRVDRMVVVNAHDTARSQDFGISYPDYRDYRSRIRSLSGLAAYRFLPVNLSDGSGLPERYFCVEMSANGFDVMGYRPILGRRFVDADERPGAQPVVMLSHHVWQERYGEDRAIVGKTVRINEVPATVVGVMPAGRRFPEDTDLWTPLIPDAARAQRAGRGLLLFGRLADGVSLNAARGEVNTISHALAGEYLDADKGITASAAPVLVITGAYGMRPVLIALFCAVGCSGALGCAIPARRALRVDPVVALRCNKLVARTLVSARRNSSRRFKTRMSAQTA